MRLGLLLYYVLFGPKYTRWALFLFVLGLGFFFFCFVHEAFDSPRLTHSIAAPYRPKPMKLGLPAANRPSVNPSIDVSNEPIRKKPAQPAIPDQTP
jgi:hypothetical protein